MNPLTIFTEDGAKIKRIWMRYNLKIDEARRGTFGRKDRHTPKRQMTLQQKKTVISGLAKVPNLLYNAPSKSHGSCQLLTRTRG